MATISGGRKHTRALLTIDTERDDTLVDGETIRERFVLRSDGALLARLVSYGIPGQHHRPSSGFRVVAKFDLVASRATVDALVERRVAAQGRRVLSRTSA